MSGGYRTQFKIHGLEPGEIPIEGEPIWDPIGRKLGFWDFTHSEITWFRVPKYGESESYIPKHRWSGTKLQFQEADGTWGDAVDLYGGYVDNITMVRNNDNSYTFKFFMHDGEGNKTFSVTTEPMEELYSGTWDATNNSPNISSGQGKVGQYYIVDVAGTTDVDGINAWNVGDQIRFNGTIWQRIAVVAPVTSVNGKSGAVILDANDISGVVKTSDIGAPLGIPALDSSGKVDSQYLPVDGSFQGTWNADTNTPTIVSGTGISGQYYVVAVTGTTNIDGVTTWNPGDQIKFNGTVWQRVPSFNAISTVNGMIGNVVLDADDIAETTRKYVTQSEKDKLAGIAAGATANSTDSSLRDRATHTGVQSMATITGLSSALDLKLNASSKATQSDVETGTDNTKYLTAYSVADVTEKAINALQPTAGVYRIPTFIGATSASIPVSVERVLIESYNSSAIRGAAHYKSVSSEPSHSLKFQNNGRWFEIDETIITPVMAGAIGDGVVDDGVSIQAALTAAGILKRSVFIPSGTYLTGIELKIPDGVRFYGNGANFTVIKAHSTLGGNLNVITNSLNDHTEHASFNKDVHVSDMTVDGNYQERSSSYNASVDAFNGSNIKFASVHNGSIRRVRSINAVLHCFDIAASVYKTPGAPKQERPLGPSLHCAIEECIAETPWYDDGFTTHDSGYIRVVNCRAIMNRLQRGTPNVWQYGFEADEGSYNVTFEDCYATGFSRGFAGKAHAGTVSAAFISFSRCHAHDCGQGFWTWDHFTVSEALTRGIVISDCIIEDPRTDNTDVVEDATLIEISNVQSVSVSRLTLINPDRGNIKITGAATKYVDIDGLSIYGSTTVGPDLYGIVTIRGSIDDAFVRVANVVSMTAVPRPVVLTDDGNSTLIFEDWNVGGSDPTKGLIHVSTVDQDGLKVSNIRGSGWGGVIYDASQSQFYGNFYRQDAGQMKWMTIPSGSPEGLVYAPAGTVCIGRASGNYWKKNSAGNLNTGWIQVT